MNTRIKLKYPYNKKWNHGYLYINNDGRRIVHLYKNDKKRSTTQYARYLMSVHLGRMLTSTEHVDHIDEDKTNDNIKNLQILTPKENNLKTHKKPDVKLKCPICSKTFSRTRTQLRGRLHRLESVCCSRRCGGTYSHKNMG